MNDGVSLKVTIDGTINGIINGNLITAGERVEIKGTVAGSVGETGRGARLYGLGGVHSLVVQRAPKEGSL